MFIEPQDCNTCAVFYVASVPAKIGFQVLDCVVLSVPACPVQNIIKIEEDRLHSGVWCGPFLSNHFLSNFPGFFLRAVLVLIYFSFFPNIGMRRLPNMLPSVKFTSLVNISCFFLFSILYWKKKNKGKNLEKKQLNQNGRKIFFPKFRNFTEAKILGRLRIPQFRKKIRKIWEVQKCARNKTWKLR